MVFNLAYAIGWLGVIARLAGLPAWAYLTLYVPAVVVCAVIIVIGLIPYYQAMLHVYLEDWYGRRGW